MPQGVQLAKLIVYSLTKDALFLVQMDIINQAQLVFNAIALAILVLEGQIQSVSLVQLLYYSSTKLALLLALMDIINQA